MCFNTKITSKASELKKRFKAKMVEEEQYEINIQSSGFNYPQTPIISNLDKDNIQLFNWGLIPNSAENEDIRSFTLNAKIETLSEKPSFKNSINKRCLVIANGFYEWKWHDTKGRNKEKFLVGLENEDLFAFAGIWSSWKNPFNNEIVNSYSIVTTEANKLMAEIHNIKKRMPVVLSPKNEINWLEGDEINDFRTIDVDLIAVSQENQQSLF
ncbi:SOS response-associated peptidase [Flavobacteriales bacterium]|nr:SOS response-associated peptidase [Flavobacteriales bacterium]